MERRTQFVVDNSKADGQIFGALASPELKGDRRPMGVNLTSQQQDYLLPHFTMIIVGKPGSGKTTLIRELLVNQNYYYRKFDTVLIISPSAGKMGIPVQKANTIQELDLKWLEEKLLKINENQVRDIIRELKANDKLKPFEKEKEPSMIKHAGDISNTASRVNFNSHVLKMDRFISNDMKSAIDPASKSSIKKSASGTQQQQKKSLTEYIDEMHMQYVTRMDTDELQHTFKNVLIVMDDVVSQIKAAEHSPLLSQLFFNRRHLVVNGMVSIMVVSQKYTMIPARIRSNANWLILYRLNPVDFDNVYKDVIMMSPNEWRDLLQYVYGESYDHGTNEKAKSHDTLGIWVEYDILFKNFQRLQLQR